MRNIRFSRLIMAQAKRAKIVEIDGSVMEGGGQILRLASSLSAILSKPIHIFNIRAGRKNPGLRPQHLNGLYLLRDMTNGKIKGARTGSTEIWFTPGPLISGHFEADTRTAGSITLLLQSALPCLAVSPGDCNSVTLKGGTNVEWAPQIQYVSMVLQPVLTKYCGFSFDLNCVRKGFYPKGGGQVTVTISPELKTGFTLQPFTLLERGDVTSIDGVAWVAGSYGIEFAQSMASKAEKILKSKYTEIPIQIECQKEATNCIGDGSGCVITAKTNNDCIIGADALGNKARSSEQLGESAAEMLSSNIEAEGCVDEHLQDQLIIFALLAEGKSRFKTGRLTMHTQTAIHIAKLMTEAKISVTEIEDGGSVIEIDGLACHKL